MIPIQPMQYKRARPNKRARPIFSLLLLPLLLLMAHQTVQADPLAPSLLELTEISSTTEQSGQQTDQQSNNLNSSTSGKTSVKVLWRTPLQMPPSNPLPLNPVLDESCAIQSGDTSEPRLQEKRNRVHHLQLECEYSLTGKTFGVNNIISTSANVLLRIRRHDGTLVTQILTPDQPLFTIPEAQSSWQVFKQYLFYGIEHLAEGLDHILFVVTLVMLVGIHRKLLIIITLFTLGHSITLSLAVLGFVNFPQALAEICIALSIVMTAGAGIRQQSNNRSESLIARKPGSIAIMFGLLHGLGFAGALLDVGLPENEIPVALLAFNLGIEIGQLILIAMLVVLSFSWQWILELASKPLVGEALAGQWQNYSSSKIAQLLGYAIGVIAAYWFWQRLLEVLV